MEVPVGASSKNAMVPLATVNTRNILFIHGGALPIWSGIIKQRPDALHSHEALTEPKINMIRIRISFPR